MNRKNIENHIIKDVISGLREFDCEKKADEMDSGIREVNLQFVIKDITNTFNFRFTKKNFLKCEIQSSISSKKIDSLIKGIDSNTLEEDGRWVILGFNLNSYFHPNNKESRARNLIWEGMYSSDIYLDKSGTSEKNLNKVSKIIFKEYINPFLIELLPKIDSLEKIESIINDEQNLIDDHNLIHLSCFFPYYSQLVVGLLLSQYLDMPNKHELSERYLNLSKSNEDNFGYSDLFAKLYEFYLST
jgi:hypothetical protein